jgi:hypothetical protein
MKKSTPKLALTDLLRRRKMTLAEYLTNSGITTYEKLLIVCERQFVLPPDRAKFDELVGGPKSNPTEGVVVIMPEPETDPEPPKDDAVVDPEFPTASAQKARRKKQGLPTEPTPAPRDSPTEESVKV